MGKAQPKQRETADFVCPNRHKFQAPPGRIEPVEGRDWHPWDYFASCPECGEEAGQPAWALNLLKAHSRATGPRTPEGKAASAANLAGHPTPEEAQITRLNALKHGAYSKVALFFPARPGNYPQCDNCEHLKEEDCLEFKACLKQGELFVKYMAAFQNGDPTVLRGLIGTRQAAVQVLIDQMILAIAKDGGPEIVSPEWFHDKDGGFHLARYQDPNTGEYIQLHKIEEHPLLKRLMEYIFKNSMTLNDMGMTPKAQDEQETIKGYLDQDMKNREDDRSYRGRLEKQNNDLLQLIHNSTQVKGLQPIDVTKQGEIIDVEPD